MNYDSIIYIIEGIGVTLQYTLISIVLGLIIGVAVSLCKLSSIKALRWFGIFYVSIFRGTPLLVQLSIIYFSTPVITNYNISVFEAGIIAFSLNSAAYITEIIRSGIEAVDRGQFEAAKALGLPYRLIMKDIILPQALRNILPALANEVVNLLKETAIISVLGGTDIMRRANIVSAEHYIYFAPLITAALCYYVMVVAFSAFAKYLEYRLKIS
jgi:His/Glu/Gln/Arg/opine family amino acid ABC transporter permease subunit